jgi:hypothetical protein
MRSESCAGIQLFSRSGSDLLNLVSAAAHQKKENGSEEKSKDEPRADFGANPVSKEQEHVEKRESV